MPGLDEVLREVKAALAALEREQAAGSADGRSKVEQLLKAEDWALRAATRKRLAEVQYLKGMASAIWKETLEGVLEDYNQGLQQGIQVDHWILVQYFVIRLVIGKTPKKLSNREEIFWNQAVQSVKLDLTSDKPADRMWARASQVDLLMVALALPEGNDRKKKWKGLVGVNQRGPENVEKELKSMVEESGKGLSCPAIRPTFRQFWRWHCWWSDVAREHSEIRKAAERGYGYLSKMVKERQIQLAGPSISEPDYSI